jgi:hypothetical protein
VVVRADAYGTNLIEAMDPAAVLSLVGRDKIAPITTEVRSRLERMLKAVCAKVPSVVLCATASAGRIESREMPLGSGA